MNRSPQRNGWLWVVVGAGLLLRLLVLLGYLGTHGWKAETWEPEEVAVNMLEGRGFTFYNYGPHVYRSHLVPVFPALLYVVHLVGGRGFALYYALHLAIAGGVIWLTFMIANRWLDFHTALLAAWFVALEPGLILYHSYKVDDIALGTFLLLLGFQLFLLAMWSGDGRVAGLLGVVLGLGLLTRPDFLGVLGVIPVYAWLERRRIRQVLKLVLLVVVPMGLIWAPWAVRNYAVQGQFVFLTTYSGESLWRGNNPNSTGTTVTLDGKGQFEAAPVEFKNRILAANEAQKDAIFKEEARRFIADDPAGFLWRATKKFSYFWWFTPTYAGRYYEWVPLFLVRGYQMLYAGIFLFLMLAVVTVAKSGELHIRRITLLLLSVPLSMSIIHSVSYVEGRHRVLVMPFMLILAAYGMKRSLVRTKSVQWSTAAVSSGTTP